MITIRAQMSPRRLAIAGAVIVGGLYGCIAALRHQTVGGSPWGVVLTILAGAALGGCAASALSRWIWAYRYERAIARGQAAVQAVRKDRTRRPACRV